MRQGLGLDTKRVVQNGSAPYPFINIMAIEKVIARNRALNIGME
jgi:hypothetical protein